MATMMTLVKLLFLSGCLLLSPCLLAEGTTTKSQQEIELSVVNSEIEQLQTAIEQENQLHQKLLTELEKTETQIGTINKRQEEACTQVGQLEDQLNALHEEQEATHEKLSQQQKALEEQLRAAYRMGEQQYIKMLLNQENTSTVGRTMAYYHYFHQHRLRFIADLTDTIEHLVINEEDILEKTAELKKAQSQIQKDRQAILQKQRERRQVLTNIKSTLSQKSARLSQLKEDKFQLEKTINQLQENENRLFRRKYQERLNKFKTPQFTKQKAKLPWPTTGKIVKHFGSNIEQSDLTWNGTLIKAKEGSEVHAIYPGKVLFSGWMRGFGLLIIIDHGNEYMSLYGRNSSLYKKVGDLVEPDDLIAKVGQSGGYEESGLYFEIRHKGRPENPEKWCNKNIENRQSA